MSGLEAPRPFPIQADATHQPARRRDTLTGLNKETHEAINSVMASAVSILTFEPERDTKTGEMQQRERAIGAGFVIAPGLIATNRHVIADVEQHPHDSIAMKTSEVGPDGQLREKVLFTSARVAYASPDYDVAFVTFNEAEHPEIALPPVPLGNTQDIHAGTTIVTIGSPYAIEDTVARGIVANEGLVFIETEFGKNPYIQVDASIRPGNSGGMAIDPSLDPSPVIGVPTLGINDDPSSGYILPIELFLEEYNRWQGLTAPQAAA